MGCERGAAAERLYPAYYLCGWGKKVYDARPLLDKAIYAQLNSLNFFLKAKADCGTVVWNDDVDIAPEHLYECSIPIGGMPNV